MNKKQKEETIEVFAEAFREVVIPIFEEMKEDISEMKEDISEVKATTNRIERKMNAMEERQDSHSFRIEKLEKIHPKGKHATSLS